MALFIFGPIKNIFPNISLLTELVRIFLAFCCKLEGSEQEKLLISGEYDLISPKEKLEVLYGKLKEPKVLRFIPGADHFFFGKEHVLAQEVLKFFSSYPKG